jgi:hypothetical protein
MDLLNRPSDAQIRDDGYGLIGGAALVYLGIAVRNTIEKDAVLFTSLKFPDLHWCLQTSAVSLHHYVQRRNHFHDFQPNFNSSGRSI